MPKPLGPALEPPALDGRVPHELDLEGMTAGSFFTIGRHQFMTQRMNLTTVASVPRRRDEDPMRDLDEIDLRLVHAWWKCCDE